MSLRMNRAVSDRPQPSLRTYEGWPFFLLALAIVIVWAFAFNHPRHIGYVSGGISTHPRVQLPVQKAPATEQNR